MNYRGIIFDLDDTIWDFKANSKAALYAVWQEISQASGLNINKYDEFLTQYNILNMRLWKEYREGKRAAKSISTDRFKLTALRMGIKLSQAKSEEIANSFLKVLYNGDILMPYALEVLEYLSAKYYLGLITNGFAKGLKRLKSCNLERYFKAVICSETFGKPKPDTGIFLHIVGLLGGEAREYVYVGDNYDGDIVGAKNAGLDAIFYNVNAIDFSNYYIQPNIEIKSLFELKAFL